MPPPGGPCRVEAVWAVVNDGINYTELVQGACPLSLLQWYTTKHGASGTEEQ